MLRRLLAITLLLLGAVAAHAQVQYAQKVTPIKAGVLLVEDYNLVREQISMMRTEAIRLVHLDHSSSVKPSDWRTFFDPHAATRAMTGCDPIWDGSGPAASPGTGLGFTTTQRSGGSVPNVGPRS